jgi:hypothetical protein
MSIENLLFVLAASLVGIVYGTLTRKFGLVGVAVFLMFASGLALAFRFAQSPALLLAFLQ